LFQITPKEINKNKKVHIPGMDDTSSEKKLEQNIIDELLKNSTIENSNDNN
jgi:hypothetical protein